MEKTPYTIILELMRELSPLYGPTLKDVAWFTAYSWAQELEDMTTKAIARMVTKGSSVSFTTEEDVNDHWMEIDDIEDLKEALIEFGYTLDFKGE